jgi:xanthine dehydrogenase accessory factor
VSEPLDARQAAQLVQKARRAGEPLTVVTAVSGPSLGKRIIVYANGATHGSLGNAALDAAASHYALDALAARTPAVVAVDAHTRLFCEPLVVADELVIVGAGHIAVPLAQLGVLLGFQVTVLDDRDEFATEERFADGVRVLRTDFSQPFAQVELSQRSYVVLVTRAHRYDYDCLKELIGLDVQPAYVGMIGSRRRVRAAFHALLESGVAPEKIAHVRAPVGLDLGAETPAEIAVSIAAELVRERSGTGSGASLSGQERVLERFFTTKEAQ